MIGETVSHYRILSHLGEGGMGVVYLAEHTTLGRRVAMKFLSTTTKDYRARFIREARAISALNHPTIATVYDDGETPDGQPYIVMELINGRPLNEKLREGSLPFPEAVRIVSAIAAALGEAHHQGVVHRDVKPSNVVITERGQVKVLDFGLVKQITEQTSLAGDPNQKTLPSTRTQSNVIVGTPLYLSPEQATGRPIDGRSDLFALGVLLYECITGQPPFSGTSVIEIGAQVLHVTPPVPSRINSYVPAELDRITMKAIEKKAEARYQNAQEFIDDLQNVLPTLEDNGHRQGRLTEPLPERPTQATSVVTTLIEPFRRPGPNLGFFILALIAVVTITWVVIRWWKPAPYKPNATAKSWYDKGADALRNGAFLQASRALEQSVAADPNYALAHARLAEAWTELDYGDKAKDEMLRVQTLVPNRSQLATTDSLYLEAINGIVSRDYDVAVKDYTELVRLSPNEAKVYVDLGRAYEKNEELQKAIDSYLEATKRDQQYAPAFLGLGALYARQLDDANANAAFDHAQTIYKALGNFEGEGEVEFQRGFLLDKKGKFAEAREHLERALELSGTTSNDYLHVKTLQKLGDVEIDGNNVAGGRKYMLDAVALAQQKGIDNLVKRGLVDLANTYIAEGNYDEAQKYVQQSLDLSLQQKDARNAARARLVLGSISERKGNSDDTAAYVEQALPFYEQGGYRKELLQALALLGRAKVQKGDYESGRQAFEKELKFSEQFHDSAQAALAHEDLGLILIKQGRHTEALQQFSDGYALATALGNKKNIASNLINRANALWRLGRYDEARAALNEAAPMADTPQAPKNLAASYNLTMGRMALSQRVFPEALNRSQQALTLSGTTLKRVLVVATFTNGVAQSLSGSSAGRGKCEQIMTTAKEIGDPLLMAESLIALSETQLQGDASAALKSAVEAKTLATQVGSVDTQFAASVLAARASQQLKDLKSAQEFASAADQLSNSLQQRWGDENYKSFLSRPDVQFSRTQIAQILSQRN